MPVSVTTKPRWRPQFGLRTLLVGATIAGALLAVVAARMRTAERQADLASQLAARGVIVYFEDSEAAWLPAAWTARLGGRVPLGVVGPAIDDEALRLVGQLAGLRLLRFEGAQITDAGLAHLERLSSVEYVDLRQTGIGDAGLAHLAALTAVTTLKLGGTQVSDAGLEHLEPLTRLESLEIDDSPATYAGCLHLLVDLQGRSVIQGLAVLDLAGKDAQELANLELGGPQVTAGLAPYLKRASGLQGIAMRDPLPSIEAVDSLRQLPELKRVWIGDIAFDAQFAEAVERLQLEEVAIQFTGGWTDQNLQAFKKFARVTDLDLSSNPISDAGLANLQHLRGLTGLRLYSTSVSDEGLRHIASFKELRMLDLSGTKITDAGLVHLNELPALEFLQLSQTQITDKGLQMLRAHPRLLGVHTHDTQVSAVAQEAFRTSRPDRERWDPHPWAY